MIFPRALSSSLIMKIVFVFVFVSYCTIWPINGAFCPAACKCLDKPPMISVDCTRANLSNFPILFNPRTRSLILGQNRISTLTADELSTYPDLEYLDLSQNKILSIERGAFFRLSKLKVLRLNANMLASLSIETFAGLSDLKVLDLSDNGLQRLATSIFSDLPNLESLNLSNNAINAVSPGALTNLRLLKELHWRYNDLRRAPKVALRSCGDSLRVLDLSHNRIESIDDESFSTLLKLEDLNLSNNQIERIEDDGFLNLINLQHLNLNSNRLFRVPTMSFRHMTELQTLTMDENLISELPTSGFEGLTRLKMLSVARCPHLTSTSLNAFSGLYELETLILAENRQLTEFHPASFEQQYYPYRTKIRMGQQQIEDQSNSASISSSRSSSSSVNLRRVHLYDNNLRSLPENLLPFDQLEELDLRHNPWRCDCKMKFIGGVLRQIYGQEGQNLKTVGEMDDGQNLKHSAIPAQCHSPEAFIGRPLISLEEYEFDCHSYSDSNWILSLLIVASTLILLTATLALVLRFRKTLFEVLHDFNILLICANPDNVSDGQSSSKNLFTGHQQKKTFHKNVSRPFLNKNFYQRQHYVIAEPYVDIGHGIVATYDSKKGSAGSGTLLGSTAMLGATARYGDYCFGDYETPHRDFRPLMATSDYYSTTGSCLLSPSPNSNTTTQCSTLDRIGSFRVIQTYPIPITEV